MCLLGLAVRITTIELSFGLKLLNVICELVE